MKKRTLTLLAALALMAGAASVFAETATVQIDGGTLSVTAANVTLATVTLDGTDQVTTSAAQSPPWDAVDGRGTGYGWHLTIASTDFTTEDVQTVSNDGDTTDTFTLAYGATGPTVTNDIDWDAAATVVKSELEGLGDITTVTVTGNGTAAIPWVIRFDAVAVSDTLVAVDTGMTSTVTLEMIDISVVADQNFRIQLTEPNIVLVVGNAKPTTSVASLTDIADNTLTFASAAEDEGMGSYTVAPNFDLAVRAEVYAGLYTATLTVAAVTAP